MTESVTYITDDELLAMAIPSAAISAVAVATRDKARKAASDIASSYFKKRFGLPLLTWGDDVKQNVAMMATYIAMKFRGFDPASESGALIVKGYDDAILWCRDVAKGVVEPTDITDTTAEVDEQAPLVSSDDAAGWSWPTVASDTEA